MSPRWRAIASSTSASTNGRARSRSSASCPRTSSARCCGASCGRSLSSATGMRPADRHHSLSISLHQPQSQGGVIMLDIAIVEGVRTPFAKAFGTLASVPAQELGRLATQGVLQRADLRPDQIDQVIFGNVALPADAANIGRVIALLAGIPQDRIAHTVQRNCASGMEAITNAAHLVQ